MLNPDKSPTYPQTVYKITCNPNHPNNPQGIETVYVGQWDEATMSGALQSNERWINLFKPSPIYGSLFNQYEDFATFEPFDLLYKTNPSTHKLKHNIRLNIMEFPLAIIKILQLIKQLVKLQILSLHTDMV